MGIMCNIENNMYLNKRIMCDHFSLSLPSARSEFCFVTFSLKYRRKSEKYLHFCSVMSDFIRLCDPLT